MDLSQELAEDTGFSYVPERTYNFLRMSYVNALLLLNQFFRMG